MYSIRFRGLSIWLGLVGIAFLTWGFGASPSGYTGDVETRIRSFFSARSSFHTEKLWLHLDKPYYGAGDSIWFRGYLVDASTHRADTLTNYIYVDLSDRCDRIVISRKIRRDSCGFANCLPLPAKLAAGDYTIRAYTSWMMNEDPAFFFQRNLRIGNSISDQINSSVEYVDREDGSRQAVVRFYNADKAPYTDAEVKYRLHGGKRRVRTMIQRTTSTGAVFVDLPPDSLPAGSYLEVEFTQSPFYYKRDIFIPVRPGPIALQFFPEGGDLLAGIGQTVAFKAERPDGNPGDVSGAIVGRSGDTAALFSTEHDGMGAFFLPVRSGESYRALVRDAGGEIRSFSLPEIHEQGYALSAVQSGGTIRYRIDCAGQPTDSLWLVGHTRGRAALIMPVASNRPTGRIATDSLEEGIFHLLLVDGQGRPRSERLVFIRHPEQDARWRVVGSGSSGQYGRREKVTLQMELADPQGRPLSGDFSVSVTDRRTVRPDSSSDHIVSNLLLSSDIKGHIASPGWYFLSDDRRRLRGLDLVMLTHGWRRFAVENLLQIPAQNPSYFIEHGQYLSGHVTGVAGRDAVDGEVLAIATGRGIFGMTRTDSRGKFVIDGLDYCDSTTFLVSARTRRGKPVQQLTVDTNYLRPSFERHHPFAEEADDMRKVKEDYLQSVREKYFSDGGMKVYQLEEVKVLGENPRKPRASIYSDLQDTTVLAKYEKVPLVVYVSSLPGVARVGGKLLIRRRTADFEPRDRDGDPMYHHTYLPLSINGRSSEPEDLAKYFVNDVLFINLIRPFEEATPNGAPSYLLEIVLKEDVQFDSDVVVVKTRGYAQSVRFYHPVYDTPERRDDSKPDKRTTLYWNPCVRTDSTGRARVSFYTDDSPAPQYDVTIEGVTADGKPCRYFFPL